MIYKKEFPFKNPRFHYYFRNLEKTLQTDF